VPVKIEPAVWSVLRALGWTVTTLWAALVTYALVAVLLDGTNSIPAGLVGFGVFLLPCLPFWWWQARRIRRRRRAARDVAAPPPRARVERPAAEVPSGDHELERLPPEMRDQWRLLEQARDLVVGFAEQGWVEREALVHVDEHTARLRRLLEADARTDLLGGTSSATLRRQVEELGALLVALADEAVEHQASLASDDPVPVTLAEARDRLATTTTAYQELSGPEARDLQQPG
jgi:hypothetical protein